MQDEIRHRMDVAQGVLDHGGTGLQLKWEAGAVHLYRPALSAARSRLYTLLSIVALWGVERLFTGTWTIEWGWSGAAFVAALLVLLAAGAVPGRPESYLQVLVEQGQIWDGPHSHEVADIALILIARVEDASPELYAVSATGTMAELSRDLSRAEHVGAALGRLLNKPVATIQTNSYGERSLFNRGETRRLNTRGVESTTLDYTPGGEETVGEIVPYAPEPGADR